MSTRRADRYQADRLRPHPRRSGLLLVASAAAAGATQVWLQSTYRGTGMPVSLIGYALEGDPMTLRSWYAQLAAEGTLGRLIRTELIDLLWAVLLGLSIVCLVRFVASLGWFRRPALARTLLRCAPLFAAGPALDLVENSFSLAMLTDPAGFPDWWAGAHGTAGLLKLGLSGLAAATGVVVSVIVALPRRGSDAPPIDDERDAAPALSPR